MNIALLLSGGTGSRTGLDIPKQYAIAGGRMIISYSLDVLLSHPLINGVMVVCDSAWIEKISSTLSTDKVVHFCEPGANRQLSIYNGLIAISDDFNHIDVDRVFIHDAARPNLTSMMVTSYLAASEKCDGAMPVLPMKDTVYISQDGHHVSSLIDRKTVFAGQAPEVFDYHKYLEANRVLIPDRIKSINGSSEPAIMAGMNIAMVDGDEHNYKITSIDDYHRFLSEVENTNK